MCPLRVILLFLSAILAGYFAIKTVRAQAADSILELQEDEQEASAELMENTGTFNKVNFATLPSSSCREYYEGLLTLVVYNSLDKLVDKWKRESFKKQSVQVMESNYAMIITMSNFNVLFSSERRAK